MPEKQATTRAPAGLKARGRALWKALSSDLTAGFAFDSRELHLLNEACLVADHVADLETVLSKEGMTSTGSAGQTVAHPALVESRQQRLVLVRLLASLEFGDAAAGGESLNSRRASHAAESRWTRRDQVRTQRAAIRQKGAASHGAQNS